ncbi:MAG: thioredoxin [Propionibacteriaceae bacterium]|jgi:thioredoxin 1|nr:thioredoxin [Propionibacteriaceae bacterium]
MSHIPAVTDATFEAEVVRSDLPVLVDYWADWCAPCRQLEPVVEKFAQEYEGRVKFVSLDVNTNTDIPLAYNVVNLPTIHLFKAGQVVGFAAGGEVKSKLRRLLSEAV